MKVETIYRHIVITLFVVMLLLSGCQRGDIKVSPVVENQASPHAGYNIGPELWVEQGDTIKVTGAVIWIKGTDPNDLFGN